MKSNKAQITLFLLFVLSLGSLSSNIIAPSLPELASVFEAKYSTISLVISLFALGYSMGQLISGFTSDFFGRRKVLVTGLILYTVSTSLCGMSQNIYLLIFFRILQGAGAGVGTTIYRAAIYDIFKGNNATKIFSYLSSSFAMITMLAPLLGGVLSEYLSWHYVFVFLATMGTVLIFVCLYIFEETNKNRTNFEKGILGTSWGLIKTRIFITNTLLLTVTYSSILLITSTSSTLLSQNYGVDGLHISLFYVFIVFAYMVGNVISGKYISQKNYLMIVYTGLSIMLLSHLAALFIDEISLWWYCSLLFCSNIGIGMIFPVCSGEIVRNFPEHRGTVSALYGSVQMFCSSLLVSVISLFSDHTGDQFFCSLFFLSLAGTILYFISANLFEDSQGLTSGSGTRLVQDK